MSCPPRGCQAGCSGSSVSPACTPFGRLVNGRLIARRQPRSISRATGSSSQCRASSAPFKGGGLSLQGPPDSYDFRGETYEQSLEIVRRCYPTLTDLVQEGTLVVVPRPENYVERRVDGYQEPEVVFVIGTAHLSTRSAEDVRRVVAAVRPENVVVELCKGRAAIMYQDQGQGGQQQLTMPGADAGAGGEAGGQQRQEQPGGSATTAASSANAKASNPLNLSGSSLVGAISRSLALGGRDALLLRAALASLSGSLSARLGVVSGGEFVAARQAAELIDAQVVLGDRPIEITLRRAWCALDWRARLSLAREIATGLRASSAAGLWDGSSSGGAAAGAGTPTLITQETVEALKSDDVISALFAQLSSRFPQVMSPLVHERDLYLAWSLKRSKAVCGTRAAVGVIGRGHLRGVVHALRHDNGELRFKDLVGRGIEQQGSKVERAGRLAARLALEASLAAAGYAAWVAWHPPA